MTNGFKVGAFAAVAILLMALLARTFGYGEPIEIPDWQAREDSIIHAYELKAVGLRQQVQASGARADSSDARADYWQRRSLANRPARLPRVGTIIPESGIGQPTSQLDGVADTNPDSASVIAHLHASNDSLWTALDASDSAYQSLDAAFTAQKEATAAAMAGWALADSTLSRERNIANLAITDLTGRLRKARRGCRVLGLLPCPTIGPSYSANVGADGRVHTGPGVSVQIPIKLGGS